MPRTGEVFGERGDPLRVFEFPRLRQTLPKNAIVGPTALGEADVDCREGRSDEGQQGQVAGRLQRLAGPNVLRREVDLQAGPGEDRRRDPVPELSRLAVIDDHIREQDDAPDCEPDDLGRRVRHGEQDQPHAGGRQCADRADQFCKVSKPFTGRSKSDLHQRHRDDEDQIETGPLDSDEGRRRYGDHGRGHHILGDDTRDQSSNLPSPWNASPGVSPFLACPLHCAFSLGWPRPDVREKPAQSAREL